MRLQAHSINALIDLTQAVWACMHHRAWRTPKSVVCATIRSKRTKSVAKCRLPIHWSGWLPWKSLLRIGLLLKRLVKAFDWAFLVACVLAVRTLSKIAQLCELGTELSSANSQAGNIWLPLCFNSPSINLLVQAHSQLLLARSSQASPCDCGISPNLTSYSLLCQPDCTVLEIANSSVFYSDKINQILRKLSRPQIN